MFLENVAMYSTHFMLWPKNHHDDSLVLLRVARTRSARVSVRLEERPRGSSARPKRAKSQSTIPSSTSSACHPDIVFELAEANHIVPVSLKRGAYSLCRRETQLRSVGTLRICRTGGSKCSIFNGISVESFSGTSSRRTACPIRISEAWHSF